MAALFRNNILFNELNVASLNFFIENAHTKVITSVAFSKDDSNNSGPFSSNASSSFFASGSLDKSIKVWDTTLRTSVAVFVDNFPVFALAFVPNSQMLLSGGEDYNIQVWNVYSRSLALSIAVGSGPVYTISVAPQVLAVGCGSTLFVASYELKDGTLGIKNSIKLSSSSKDVRATSFSAHGDLLLAGGDDCIVTMYSVAPDAAMLHCEKLRVFEGHKLPILGLSFAPDAISFLSASQDAMVRLWHVEVCVYF